MSTRTTVILILCSVLVSHSSQEDAHGQWIPVKDVLVQIAASPAGPSATYIHFQPSDESKGRRLPAVFLVKTPKEEDVVAYLTAVDGELGDDLLDMVNDGEKVMMEYVISAPKPSEEKEQKTERDHLPHPFGELHLSRVQLPRPFISLSELARFSVSRHSTTTGKIFIVLVAERLEVIDESEEEEDYDEPVQTRMAVIERLEEGAASTME